jgi:hypothetical protein
MKEIQTPLITYTFPSSYKDLKDHDVYQIRLMNHFWTEVKEHNSNICSSQKDYLKFLIANGRLRVRKITN